MFNIKDHLFYNTLCPKENVIYMTAISTIDKLNRTTKAQHFHSSNHHKWLPYQILSGKTVKNVKIKK